MTNVRCDDNRVPTIAGVLNTDGATPTLVKANASTHVLQAMDGTTGSDLGSDNARHDDNREPVMLAASSADDGAIVQLYVNSTGQLLIDSS